MLNLKSLFPSLGDKSPEVTNRNPSYTKKGPGRRHSYTNKQNKDVRILSEFRGNKFLHKIRSGKVVHIN